MAGGPRSQFGLGSFFFRGSEMVKRVLWLVGLLVLTLATPAAGQRLSEDSMAVLTPAQQATLSHDYNTERDT